MKSNNVLKSVELDRIFSFTEPELSTCCTYLNDYLETRSFFDGYELSGADESIYAELIRNPYWTTTFKRSRFPHLLRWFSFCQNTEFASKLNSPFNIQIHKENIHSLKDLPDAVMGNVVTRFPPEPSGYLHIGHCKALLLNYNYSVRYKGKFILRFDDTNPSKESAEFEDSILQDMALLNVKPNVVSHTSDHFELISQKCEELISRGLAYCDATPKDQMRKEKTEKIESAYRNVSISDNLAVWQQMKSGTPEGSKYLVRAKIDMSSLNGAMRDPGIYRVNLVDLHYRTGSQYKVYPLYDFSCPILDSVEGVTHVMRSNEFHDRDEQYQWFLKVLGYKSLKIIDYSRLNFSYHLLSKRKLLWFVENNKVTGWDDPRFPTIRGLLRRGLCVEALVKFIMEQGASKNINLMDTSKLWALNKIEIDPITPRHTVISKDNAVVFFITGAPTSVNVAEKPKHKKNPALGNKCVYYLNKIFIEREDATLLSEGEEITLMDWGNAIVNKIVTSEQQIITEMHGVLHLEGDYKKTKRKLTWLPDIPELVSVRLVEYDNLICKPSLSSSENFEDFLTPTTLYETECFGDPNLASIPHGQKLQLERRGYYIVDSVSPSQLLLINIPDGAQKSPSVLSKNVKLK